MRRREKVAFALKRSDLTLATATEYALRFFQIDPRRFGRLFTRSGSLLRGSAIQRRGRPVFLETVRELLIFIVSATDIAGRVNLK